MNFCAELKKIGAIIYKGNKSLSTVHALPLCSKLLDRRACPQSMTMLSTIIFASLSASGIAAHRQREPHSLKQVENLGGCGWQRCVNCTTSTGGVVPCGPAHQHCLASANKPTYRFHLADPSCDINDPNGPFYDPVHKMYHNFYQIHIAENFGGAGDGPDWGHWVSKDFVHWAQLPVAIWNDKWYDNSAIYTGSTTIVDGKPVMMYPGKCNDKGTSVDKRVCNDGKGGFTYVLVVPENASDPLYQKWNKNGEVGGQAFRNPIINNTGDDPSTAWKTKDGEWRFIGNQGCEPEGGNPLYGTRDWVTFYKIGCTTLMAGDCPTFFPLPGLTPGSEHYVEHHVKDAPMPNRVHKSGGKGGDQTQVGVWTDGKPGPTGTGTVGTWTLTEGSVTQFLDKGKTHASKDFRDPNGNGRQIMWVWGTLESGIQTVPRDMTYHPGLKRIIYSPVAEMRQLRGDAIDEVKSKTITPTTPPVVVKASKTCDIELSFAVPTTASTIVVTFGKSTAVTIDYVPPPSTHSLFHDENGIVVPAGPPWSVEVHLAQFTDMLPMLPDDKEMTVEIFLDQHVAEVYFMGGRVAMTSDLVDLEDVKSIAIAVTGSGIATLSSATVYPMGDIHVPVASVLKQHYAL